MKMKSTTQVLAIIAMLITGTVTSFQAMAHEESRRDQHRDNSRYQQRDHHGMHGDRQYQRYIHRDRSGHKKWYAKHVRHHANKHRPDDRHYYGKGDRHHHGRHPGYYLDNGRVGITLYYRGTL